MSTDYVIRKIDHRALMELLYEGARRIASNQRKQSVWRPPSKQFQARGFRASGLADCGRKTAYRLMRAPETDDTYQPEYEDAAEQGNTLHSLYQARAHEAGIVYTHPGFGAALELPLDKCTDAALEPARAAIPFTGTIDGIFQRTNGDLLIFDLKTVQASYMKPSNRYLAEKTQHYAVQTSAYMHYFAAPDGRKARYAWVLMMNRDNTKDVVLYQIDYQPERWAVDEERLTTAAAAVRASTLPAPEISSACRFCNWQQRCIKDRTWAAMTEDMVDEVSA